MHLLKNQSKGRILYLIGCYLIERFSVEFKIDDEIKLAQNTKYQIEEIFKVIYDEIDVLHEKFEELATLKLND